MDTIATDTKRHLKLTHCGEYVRTHHVRGMIARAGDEWVAYLPERLDAATGPTIDVMVIGGPTADDLSTAYHRGDAEVVTVSLREAVVAASGERGQEISA